MFIRKITEYYKFQIICIRTKKILLYCNRFRSFRVWDSFFETGSLCVIFLDCPVDHPGPVVILPNVIGLSFTLSGQAHKTLCVSIIYQSVHTGKSLAICTLLHLPR